MRGGIFRDNYKDTGVSTTTAVIWNTPSIGVPGVPGELQLPKGSQNTPRVIITNKDQTETGFFQVDYNHAFNAAGSHLLKGGFGVRHTTNDVDSAYPGGYVLLNWGTSFVNNSGVTGTGTYGYYEVNDRGTRGTRQRQHAVAVRAGHLDARQPPDAESRRAHREGDDSLVPHRHQGRTPSSSASARRSRRGWARPTTCSATAA